jgi:hypothetical protein
MSRTLLFAPLFLDGPERFERNRQWFEHIKIIKPYLDFDEIYMVDNASNPDLLEKFEKYTDYSINIHNCRVRLNRNSEHGYGYWYRAFGKAAKYAIDNNYDRIVHIDTDVYPLNKRILDKVNSLDTGWNCFWSEMHQYPESIFQVICYDQLQNMYDFMTGDFLKFYPNGLAEKEIPWTNIIKDFKGDRFGEKRLLQTSDMDYYCQKPNDIIVKFNE